MSEVQHQLLITLVHGTWGRGFSPRLVRFKQWLRELTLRKRSAPFWFEEGSPFLARLSAGLGDIPHKIWPLLWSGANSIFVRDKTAHALADHLSAEHAEHPQATQLVIAHSHGGNIALRALHHLGHRDASQVDKADSANPLVATLATPFIEVHEADFGDRPRTVRWAVVAATTWLLSLSMVGLSDFLEPLICLAVWVFCFGLIVWWCWWWLSQRATARHNRIEALNEATQLGDPGSTQRLLVIRAIDDEASLVLALGTIFSYLTTMLIVTAYSLSVVVIGVTTWLTGGDIFIFWLLQAGWFVLTVLLLGMLIVSRSAHGRELAVSPMECQINTQSTPDAKGLSEIVTLVRRTYVKSLRHGIYDQEDCAKTISDWVYSQLGVPPERERAATIIDPLSASAPPKGVDRA
jgi:hypothetical protein